MSYVFRTIKRMDVSGLIKREDNNRCDVPNNNDVHRGG